MREVSSARSPNVRAALMLTRKHACLWSGSFLHGWHFWWSHFTLFPCLHLSFPTQALVPLPLAAPTLSLPHPLLPILIIECGLKFGAPGGSTSPQLLCVRLGGRSITHSSGDALNSLLAHDEPSQAQPLMQCCCLSFSNGLYMQLLLITSSRIVQILRVRCVSAARSAELGEKIQ